MRGGKVPFPWKRLWVKVVQPCPTPRNPMGCSPPGSSVHGVLQARIVEWIAMPFSRGSSQPRGCAPVSRTAGRFFTVWATREASKKTDLSQITCRSSAELYVHAVQSGALRVGELQSPAVCVQISVANASWRTFCKFLNLSVPVHILWNNEKTHYTATCVKHMWSASF